MFENNQSRLNEIYNQLQLITGNQHPFLFQGNPIILAKNDSQIKEIKESLTSLGMPSYSQIPVPFFVPTTIANQQNNPIFYPLKEVFPTAPLIPNSNPTKQKHNSPIEINIYLDDENINEMLCM